MTSADGAAAGGAAVPDAEPTWSIADVAAEFDLTHRTVRHYEDLGLVHPERRGSTRRYRRRDRTRLALILRGRRLGFTLPEIANILDMYDEQPGEAGQLAYLLTQTSTRRAELERRRQDIDDSLAELTALEQRWRRQLGEVRPPG